MALNLEQLGATSDLALEFAAVRYAALGFPVVPLHSVDEAGSCTCHAGSDCNGSAGKHPRISAWQRHASTEAGKVRSWWRRWPTANVGIAMGGTGRLVALDVDGELGRASLVALTSKHGPLPATLVSASGRNDGGEHRIFCCPDDLDLERIPTKRSFAPGLDVRAQGGQIVVAPSVHYSGRRYRWVRLEPIADLPRWLYDLMTARAQPQPQPAPANDHDLAERAKRATAYLRALPPAISGQGGHSATWRAAVAVVRGFDLPAQAALELLATEFNPRCEPPWSERELRHKVVQAERVAKLQRGYLLDDPRREWRTPKPPARAPQQHTTDPSYEDEERAAIQAEGAPAPAPPRPPPPATNGSTRRNDDSSTVVLARGDHVELGDHLLRRLGPARLVYAEGDLYRYADARGLWAPVERAAQSRIVQRFAGAQVECELKPLRMKASDVSGAIHLGHDQVSLPEFFDGALNGLAFANGFVRVSAQGVSVQPHAPENRARAGYSFPFASPPCPRWLAFLDGVFKDDADAEAKVAFLQEFTGACLLGIATRYQRCVVALGEGANGKSTLIRVLEAAMPARTCAAIPPQDWAQEYRRAMLAGVRFNAVSELPEADIIASEAFKAVISGDMMVGRRIREAPFNFRPVAGHLFAANRLPGTTDQTHGFWRRIVVVRFARKFDGADANPKLGDELVSEELTGVVAWAIEGARRLLGQGSYTTPPSSTEEVAEWRKSADNVALFCDARTRPASRPDEDAFANQLYATYAEWARANGFRPVSSRHFSDRMQLLGKPSRHTKTGNRYPVVLNHATHESEGGAEW